MEERTMRARIMSGIAAGMVVLAGCTSVPPDSSLPATLANPTTAAEHLRVADYHAKRVARYDAEATFHESMPLLYQARPRGDVPAIGVHCREIRRQLSAARADAAALEQAHRQLAMLLK